MSTTRRAAVLAVLGTALLPTAALAARADEVLVVNGSDRPVPASIVGTPSVSLAGTPTVAIDPATNVVRVQGDPTAAGPRPFQRLLTFTLEPDATSFCHTVHAPEGTVQRVLASVDSTHETTVRLSYLPGIGNGRRLIGRLIEAGAPSTAASTDLLLHLGLGEPSLVFQACLESTSGLRRTADVVVTGTQKPA